MAKATDKPPGIVIPLVIVTVLGAAGGFLLTRQLAAGSAIAGADADAPQAATASTKILDVSPVVTNLASPPGAFIRLQLSLVVEKSANAADANQFATDVTAYLRTVPIERLTGPAGLQQLREDLRERADIRLAGQVRDIILHDLVVQ